MKKRLLVLFMLLSMWCLPALASDWQYLGDTTDGSATYLDRETLRRSDNEATVWIQFVDTSGERLISQLHYYRNHHILYILSVYQYAANGQLVGQATPPPDPRVVFPPESIFDGIYHVIW